MNADPEALATVIAKDAIRELALLYSRGVDRQDFALLRTLYTKDARDNHGWYFNGTAADFVDQLERSLPGMRYTGHHVCNHLISVSGDRGEGEVYALAYHIVEKEPGKFVEDVMGVRYLDDYRRGEDGKWRFANRTVAFDWRTVRDIPAPAPAPAKDLSYETLRTRLFQAGPRA